MLASNRPREKRTGIRHLVFGAFSAKELLIYKFNGIYSSNVRHSERIRYSSLFFGASIFFTTLTHVLSTPCCYDAVCRK